MGGFFVNLILAIIAILAGFPLGVFLAIGRASSYKLIKLVSVIFIETLLVVALMFWVVSIILSQISRSIENRLNLSN